MAGVMATMGAKAAIAAAVAAERGYSPQDSVDIRDNAQASCALQVLNLVYGLYEHHCEPIGPRAAGRQLCVGLRVVLEAVLRVEPMPANHHVLLLHLCKRSGETYPRVTSYTRRRMQRGLGRTQSVHDQSAFSTTSWLLATLVRTPRSNAIGESWFRLAVAPLRCHLCRAWRRPDRRGRSRSGLRWMPSLPCCMQLDIPHVPTRRHAPRPVLLRCPHPCQAGADSSCHPVCPPPRRVSCMQLLRPRARMCLAVRHRAPRGVHVVSPVPHPTPPAVLHAPVLHAPGATARQVKRHSARVEHRSTAPHSLRRAHTRPRWLGGWATRLPLAAPTSVDAWRPHDTTLVEGGRQSGTDRLLAGAMLVNRSVAALGPNARGIQSPTGWRV